MSNDTAECGCEGHADNFGECRYPGVMAELARKSKDLRAWEQDAKAAIARAEAAEGRIEQLLSESQRGWSLAEVYRREREDLRAKLAAASLKLDEAGGRLDAFEDRAIAAEADNAALVKTVECLLASAFPHPTEHPSMFKAWRAAEAALASPHPGAALMADVREAHRLLMGMPTCEECSENRENAIRALRRPFAGKP